MHGCDCSVYPRWCGVRAAEDIQAMSKALDEVCKALKIDADATAEEIVAIRIIELAGRGE